MYHFSQHEPYHSEACELPRRLSGRCWLRVVDPRVQGKVVCSTFGLIAQRFPGFGCYGVEPLPGSAPHCRMSNPRANILVWRGLGHHIEHTEDQFCAAASQVCQYSRVVRDDIGLVWGADPAGFVVAIRCSLSDRIRIGTATSAARLTAGFRVFMLLETVDQAWTLPHSDKYVRMGKPSLLVLDPPDAPLYRSEDIRICDQLH
jgi:hypothetical protein